jgi:hypothetical protein
VASDITSSIYLTGNLAQNQCNFEDYILCSLGNRRQVRLLARLLVTPDSDCGDDDNDDGGGGNSARDENTFI